MCDPSKERKGKKKTGEEKRPRDRDGGTKRKKRFSSFPLLVCAETGDSKKQRDRGKLGSALFVPVFGSENHHRRQWWSMLVAVMGIKTGHGGDDEFLAK